MIRFFLYFIFLAGAALMVYPWLLYFIRALKAIKENRRQRGNKLEKHIVTLIGTLYVQKSQAWLERFTVLFYAASAGIFLILLWLMLKQQLGAAALAFSLIFALLPYLTLRLKLSSVQITGSYEGEVILSELLNQFKMNHLNMREAIDRSMQYLDRAPIGKQLLFRLSLKLRTYRTDEELKTALDEFSASCNTQWGETLAINIYYAVSEELDITAGLEDLLLECEQIKDMLEQSKRLNNEALTMTKLVAPAIYLVFMWTLVKYFDLTVSEVIHYQLFTGQGLILFAVMLIASFIAAAFATILTRPKFDF